jgi:hypothetical protein
VRTDEIRSDDVPRVAVETRQSGWFCRAFEYGIYRFYRKEIGELPNVAMDEPDAGLTQARQAQLGPAAAEVVEGDDFPVGMSGGERDSEVRAYEASAACDQHAPRAAFGRRPHSRTAMLALK